MAHNVLTPAILVAGTRRYRINVGDGDRVFGQDVTAPAAGQHTATCIVPVAFHGALVGRKGEMRRKLEADTGASISVPRQGSKDETVTVTGVWCGMSTLVSLAFVNA